MTRKKVNLFEVSDFENNSLSNWKSWFPDRLAIVEDSSNIQNHFLYNSSIETNLNGIKVKPNTVYIFSGNIYNNDNSIAKFSMNIWNYTNQEAVDNGEINGSWDLDTTVKSDNKG